MTVKKVHILIVATLLLGGLAGEANAMYHAALGRWMQRDPGPHVLEQRPKMPFFERGIELNRQTAPGNPPVAAALLSGDPQEALRTTARRYVDGMNLYRYARSRPVTAVDPTGTMLISPSACCDCPALTEDEREWFSYAKGECWMRGMVKVFTFRKDCHTPDYVISERWKCPLGTTCEYGRLYTCMWILDGLYWRGTDPWAAWMQWGPSPTPVVLTKDCL